MKGLEMFLQVFDQVDNRFIMVVKSDNAGTSASNQFTIPTFGTGYNYNVETSDGYTATGLTGNHTITFPSGAGTHEVYITGDFPQIYFNNTGDKLKLIEIKNWGDIYWRNLLSAFFGCANLTIVSANDIPKGFTDPLVSFFNCFRATGLTHINNIENWNLNDTDRRVTNLTTFIADSPNITSLNISNWDIRFVSFANLFARNVNLTNYDELLVGFEQTLQNSYPNGVGYSLSPLWVFGLSKYTIGSQAEAARTSLINNYNWTITDGGGI